MHVLVRREQGMAHVAGGYSSETREWVSVCLVTSGPVVTNEVTGIAVANNDN